MKSLILTLIFLSSAFVFAANTEKAENKAGKNVLTTNSPTAENRWYYGGNVGFSFWNDYTYLGIYPMVGYKITPQFSVGAKVGYSYINYKDIDFDTHNYGGSVFTRYRIIPQIYLHGEFVYFSYERRTFNFIRPVGKSVSCVDVLSRIPVERSYEPCPEWLLPLLSEKNGG